LKTVGQSTYLALKYVRGPGGEVQCGQGRGVFRCGRPHILMQKTWNFLKFMMYPHYRESSADKGEEVNF